MIISLNIWYFVKVSWSLDCKITIPVSDGHTDSVGVKTQKATFIIYMYTWKQKIVYRRYFFLYSLVDFMLIIPDLNQYVDIESISKFILCDTKRGRLESYTIYFLCQMSKMDPTHLFSLSLPRNILLIFYITSNIS